MDNALKILVDADACPVKAEIIKVAQRLEIETVFVANSWLRLERDPLISMVVVPGNFDAADDWIAERADGNTIVITADILLAERCVTANAWAVLGPNGKPFTANSIGMAVATRAIMSDLRAGGAQVGGPPPFSKADRSAFLSALDLAIMRHCRRG
ncbi:YaiI/YqxD family protein [Pseudohoeflea suaedae]|uniref:UPF0178 protein E2A64_04260 n=1 Tax=Pseudohoeflea suaedae TaxID=877384 RepID=A0A4R5PQT8_9HYPH|nr:YaiI/YqxD family protein [Pseudohoeflea suaedae]TDH39419.1 YaiI/YqxD family protein [Pseudohoeflea suaedae]